MNGFELHREIKKIDERVKGSRRNFRTVSMATMGTRRKCKMLYSRFNKMN